MKFGPACNSDADKCCYSAAICSKTRGFSRPLLLHYVENGGAGVMWKTGNRYRSVLAPYYHQETRNPCAGVYFSIYCPNSPGGAPKLDPNLLPVSDDFARSSSAPFGLPPTPRGPGVSPFRLCSSSLVHSLPHLLLFITFSLLLFSSTLLIFFYCPSDPFLPE